MTTSSYDILIIGGGINGAGIAADAAGRGLSVALCEQADLASGTSSASSKLIHGGLRYLEQGDFKLVHEALNEREVLLAKAPHLISPLSFVIPYQPQLRPKWLIRLGLWIYDHLAKRISLPASQGLRLPHTPYGAPLKPSLTDGFVYSDCWVDDARLVLANLQDAQAHGADILTYTRVVDTQVRDGQWEVLTENMLTGETRILHAKALIKATGPWMDDPDFPLELVKGSHIIVEQTYPGTHAYLIQHTDRRVIFVIPYQHEFTLIGTTDVPYQGDPRDVSIDATEKQYLLDIYNQYFRTPLSLSDIVAHYAGVRPLVKEGNANPSETSREYALQVKQIDGAPMLCVLGGKITTYRTLAEHAMHQMKPFFRRMGNDWTKAARLPGGDITDIHTFSQQQATRYPFLPQALLEHYVHTYGTRMDTLLAGCTRIDDLGVCVASDCYAREIDYTIAHEWVKKPTDFLYRRTKRYLTLSPPDIMRVETYIVGKLG